MERLSAVAAFSKFHFHRQFCGLFGVSVHQYVKLVRLKRASYQLAFREQSRILDIALENGYDSHEAFARAFKRLVGQTPSEFRNQPAWAAWHATYDGIDQLRNEHMTTAYRKDHVRIIDFPDTRVGALEHRGDPRTLGDSIRLFIAWRKQSRLPPHLSATYNVLHESLSTSAPDDYRMDLCAGTSKPVDENSFGVVEKVIPRGRCAVLRHVGSDATLGASIGFLYSGWLPESGEELRDFPVFLQRVRFFPDVPEHESIVDIFLPLRSPPSPRP